MVAFTFRDGASSEVWTVDVRDGKETKIAERAATVVGVEVAATMRAAFLLEGKVPFVGLDLVRVDLDSNEATVVTTIAVDSEFYESVDTELDEGTGRLLMLACGDSCQLTGVDIQDPSVQWRRPSDAWQLAGNLDGQVLATRACGIPCTMQLVDSASGEGTQVAKGCDVAALGSRFGSLVVVTDSDGRGCRGFGESSTLYVYDAGSREPTASKDVGTGYAPVPNGSDGGYALTPGVVLLTPGGSLQPVIDDPSSALLFDLSTGALIAPTETP